MDYINTTIDTVGYSGPVLLLLSSIYLLSEKTTYLPIYLVGFVFNIILNCFLKGLIQQPRPAEDKRLFNLEVIHGERISYDRYGMPSSHTQLVFYSTAFIHFVLRDNKTTAVYLLVSLITAYQRIKNKNHTFFQVLVGSITGLFMGYSLYYYGKSLLKGILRLKPDDNAPL